MSDFELAIKKTIANEGGDKYTEILGDKGGATKYGISLRFLVGVYNSPHELKKAKGTIIERLFIHEPTKDTIRYLTEVEAKFIYKTYFWDNNKYGEINDQAIAEKVFDIAVLMGAPNANKCFQLSLGFIEKDSDGIIGPMTLNRINNRTDILFERLENLKFKIINRFISICNKDKTQSKFLLGWLNRVMS